MTRKSIKYYYKILELKNRIKDLKALFAENKITLLEYRQQLREILKELNESNETSDLNDFSAILENLILRTI